MLRAQRLWKVRLCVSSARRNSQVDEMGVHKTVEHESGYFEDENSDDDAMVHSGGVCGLGRRANPAATPTSTMSTCDALNNNVAPGQDCCHAIRPAIDRGE